MKSKDIRKHFLDFFESKSHKIVPSEPIVINNDPTLMFVNAGMNQFKEYFLGHKKPKYTRIADSQKCLRISGKHNDLEEVGKDTYHQTMFEMLGNWSFGDYFKKEAINWAWELLTSVYKIDISCLYVSVFKGSKEENLGFDQETYDIWNTLVSEDHIVIGDKNDNFWEMGSQGPCGPCSEIHIDIRNDEEKLITSGASLVNKGHPQVIEIWNLVFMQYNRKSDKTLEDLPEKNVDTGMGLERLSMVLQGVKSNYQTDIFTPIIREIETITHSKKEDSQAIEIAIRVIADHLRAVSFSIADGQLPSNNGAGYVIRRILRRAIRYGFTFLKQKKAFIFKLVEPLANQMGDTFEELKNQKSLIINVIKEEETSFLKTLEQGLFLLDQVIENAQGGKISGQKAFELYDTYGFPIDLTSLIISEKGLSLDERGFEIEMEKQKIRSRKASTLETDDWVILIDDKDEEFIGYDTLEVNIKITRYRKISSKKEGHKYQLVFNMTPFYPEGGGQVGDKGYIESPNGNVVYILDTKKENNLIIHYTESLPSDPFQIFKVVVDSTHRERASSNHTATHLLHQALRTILGKHVEQKGSLVSSSYLRFDFSHYSKISFQELIEIENFVNARIREALPLNENRKTDYKKAISNGAIALFGEKYGDVVRSVEFGESKELCGGTHMNNTKDIWHFKIISESAVAAGIRRIEAITKDAVKEYFTEQEYQYNRVKSILNNPKSPLKAIENIQSDNIKLKAQIEKLLNEKAQNLKNYLKTKLKNINEINLLTAKIDLKPSKIKDLAFELGKEIENLFLLIATEDKGKASLTCYISKNLVTEKQYDASKIVIELGEYIKGGGGGQKFFATAGGKDPSKIYKVLEKVENYI